MKWLYFIIILSLSFGGCKEKSNSVESTPWIDIKTEIVPVKEYKLKEIQKDAPKEELITAIEATKELGPVVEEVKPIEIKPEKIKIIDTRLVEPPKVIEPIIKEESKPLITNPKPVAMTSAGLNLILDFETGGKSQYLKWPHPEYLNDEYSGVTIGIGADMHQVSKDMIIRDWIRLGETPAKRLSDTQPYYGHAAREPYLKVKDIYISWEDSIEVFQLVDLVKVENQCKIAFPGYLDLKVQCKDAIKSLVYNRGISMTGPARLEMRNIAELTNKEIVDYRAIANEFRKMKRVWIGKSIYNGMARRREAEAKLIESI